MQTEPQNPLPLVYLITDHTDQGTYFVQAKVRDSLTGEVLATVNLADRGNRRFTNTINAPVDGTGLGRHIDITITPYTDSGYTQKADAYQERIDRWYVRAQRTGGGGASVEIDYDYLIKKVRQIVAEAVGKIEFPATDLTGVSTQVGAVLAAVRAFDFPTIPTPERLDLAPAIRAIDGTRETLEEAIAAIEIPEPEKLDLRPVLEALRTGEQTLLSALAQATDRTAARSADAASKAIRETLAVNDKKNAAVREAMGQFFGNADLSQAVPEGKKHKYFAS